MWKWETDQKPKAVIVIIHSAFEHHRWYAWLIEKFRTEGYHVVMGDLPGHEDGSKLTRVHDEYLIDYLYFIKKLVHSALTYQLPIFIIGHGLGGTLAIQFLKKSSVECTGLILTSPWLALQKNSSLLANALASMNLSPNKKISLEFTKKALTRNIDGFTEMVDEYSYHSNVTIRWYREVQQLMKNLNAQQEKTLSLPILLMTASQDKIAEPEAAKKWLIQQKSIEFQYKEWTNSYHNLFHENQREEVFLYIRDFVNNGLRSIGYIV